MKFVQKDVFEAAQNITANCQKISRYVSPVESARAIAGAFYNPGFEVDALFWEEVARFIESLEGYNGKEPVIICDGTRKIPVYPLWRDRSVDYPDPDDEIPY